jgi:hypothetical protein
MMALRMKPVQKQVITMKLELKFKHSFADVVFPKTQSILEQDGFLDSYLKYICINKKGILKKYQSVLDFLFCEIFGMTIRRKHLLRNACFAYYDRKGPKLIDIFHKDDLKIYDIVLSSIVLPLLKETIDEYGKRAISWKRFIKGIDRALNLVQKGEKINFKYII